MQVTAYLASSTAPEQVRLARPRLADRAETGLHQLGALLILMAISPVLLLVSWMIWRVDGAPIFFGHYRVGKDGKLFRCLKFRSMRRDAEAVLAKLLNDSPAALEEWQRDQKLANDPRITGIGHFLRKTSLDELPQLINVLRGDMRLVGPRPVTPPELMRYGSVRWHYISVQPGITGLWQVSGRNSTTYEARVAMDKRYVETANLISDTKILLRTVWVVLTGHGAC